MQEGIVLYRPEAREYVAWTDFFAAEHNLQIRRIDKGLRPFPDLFKTFPERQAPGVDFTEFPKHKWPEDEQPERLSFLLHIAKEAWGWPITREISLFANVSKLDEQGIEEFLRETVEFRAG